MSMCSPQDPGPRHPPSAWRLIATEACEGSLRHPRLLLRVCCTKCVVHHHGAVDAAAIGSASRLTNLNR